MSGLTVISGPTAVGKGTVVRYMLEHFAEDSLAVQRFQQEARVIARLEHRNLAQPQPLVQVDIALVLRHHRQPAQRRGLRGPARHRLLPLRVVERRDRADDRLPFGDRQAAVGQAGKAADELVAGKVKQQPGQTLAAYKVAFQNKVLFAEGAGQVVPAHITVRWFVAGLGCAKLQAQCQPSLERGDFKSVDDAYVKAKAEQRRLDTLGVTPFESATTRARAQAQAAAGVTGKRPREDEPTCFKCGKPQDQPDQYCTSKWHHQAQSGAAGGGGRGGYGGGGHRRGGGRGGYGGGARGGSGRGGGRAYRGGRGGGHANRGGRGGRGGSFAQGTVAAAGAVTQGPVPAAQNA